MRPNGFRFNDNHKQILQAMLSPEYVASAQAVAEALGISERFQTLPEMINEFSERESCRMLKKAYAHRVGSVNDKGAPHQDETHPHLYFPYTSAQLADIVDAFAEQVEVQGITFDRTTREAFHAARGITADSQHGFKDGFVPFDPTEEELYIALQLEDCAFDAVACSFSAVEDLIVQLAQMDVEEGTPENRTPLAIFAASTRNVLDAKYASIDPSTLGETFPPLQARTPVDAQIGHDR